MKKLVLKILKLLKKLEEYEYDFLKILLGLYGKVNSEVKNKNGLYANF